MYSTAKSLLLTPWMRRQLAGLRCVLASKLWNTNQALSRTEHKVRTTLNSVRELIVTTTTNTPRLRTRDARTHDTIIVMSRHNFHSSQLDVTRMNSRRLAFNSSLKYHTMSYVFLHVEKQRLYTGRDTYNSHEVCASPSVRLWKRLAKASASSELAAGTKPRFDKLCNVPGSASQPRAER